MGGRARARLVVILAAAAALFPPSARAGPQLTTAPDFSPIGLPGAEEARSIVARVRDSGFAGAGSCYLEFDLRVMPRRGDERTLHGHLWAGRASGAPAARIVLTEAGGVESRFLVIGGSKPEAWREDSDGAIHPMDFFTPLAEGANATVFDLAMPYLAWPDPKVSSLTRVLGRPAYGFIFVPPADFAAAHPDLAAVHAFLDTQYGAPIETQIVGPDDRPLKTLSLVDLKKVGETWIVRDADIRDEATRDKTRFSVTAAALGLDLSQALFEPAGLSESVAAPAQIVRF